jgi:hypothetical protein
MGYLPKGYTIASTVKYYIPDNMNSLKKRIPGMIPERNKVLQFHASQCVRIIVHDSTLTISFLRDTYPLPNWGWSPPFNRQAG